MENYFYKIVRRSKFDKRFIKYNLCLVTDFEMAKIKGKNIVDVVESSIYGGCSMVQFREKKMDYDTKLALAKKIKEVCKNKVPFIINDDVKLAEDIDADGVHVGQDDMNACDVRKIIGNNKILGVTVGNLHELDEAHQNEADYLGTDAIFPTSSKPGKSLGLEKFRDSKILTKLLKQLEECWSKRLNNI
jgi:thiamine-phosphate diphosphorylase